MIRTVRYIVFLAAILLCVGCNSDIFVEPVPDIDDNKFTLDGNGGTVSFTIPTKGLWGVRFDSEYGTWAYASYYDKAGEYIYNPTLENVAKVVYACPLFCIEFNIDGDRVEVKALDNATSEYVNVWVGLDYEHTSQIIDFYISPGRPLEIDDLGYDIANPVSGFRKERGTPHTFNNNSDRTQRIVIYPFKEAMSMIKLDVDDYDFWWSRGVSGVIDVPFYTHGEWTDSPTNVAEVRLGDTTRFYSPDLDIEEEYVIEVPPYSKVTTVTTYTYATLDVVYIAHLMLPGSGNSYFIQGQCWLIQPIAYEITQQ